MALLTFLGACGTAESPDRTRSWDVELAGPREPGQRLVLTGWVCDSRGHPLAGVHVRIYHSDAHGNYFAPGSNRPRLAAEARSGPGGELEIRTILPASDNPIEPAHIHFEVRAGGSLRAGVVYLARSAEPVFPDTLPIDRSMTWHPPGEAGLDGRPMLPTTPITRDRTGVWRGRFEVRVS